VDIRAVYTAQEKPRSDRDHIHIGSPLPKWPAFTRQIGTDTPDTAKRWHRWWRKNDVTSETRHCFIFHRIQLVICQLENCLLVFGRRMVWKCTNYILIVLETATASPVGDNTVMPAVPASSSGATIGP
jgi:hypothetical protein